MNKLTAVVLVLGSLAIASSANAQDIKTGLVGLWKLTTHGNKNASTGAMEHPGGYQLFSKDGHHMFLMVDENRKRPAGRPTAADKSALLDSLVSYAGTYRVEGNKVLIHVEHASSPTTEADRSYMVELAGNKMTLTAEPFTNASGQKIISIRTFERLE